MYLWQEVPSQGRVLGGHSESVQRNDVPHPLGLVDDSIRVGQVGSVCHSGLAAPPDGPVYLGLDFLCVVNSHFHHLFPMNLILLRWMVHIYAPTLDVRVPDEVDEPPLQGLGGGFAASQEQIQTTQDQVPVLKSQLVVFVLRDTKTTRFESPLLKYRAHDFLLRTPPSMRKASM